MREAQTGGAFSLVEVELPIGFEAPMHRHHNEDETFRVLEGKISFFYGDAKRTAGPGDVIVLPRGGVHGFRVKGPSAARAVSLFTPGGFEEFFVELGEPAQAGKNPSAEGPGLERTIAVSERYAVDYVGPVPK